jgi:integrase
MASTYKRDGVWMIAYKDERGRWRGIRAKVKTKTLAQKEAVEAQRVADLRRDGLAPPEANSKRRFGELMDLWKERYGQRLRSQTIVQMVEKQLRPDLGHLQLGGAAAALPGLLNSKIGELSPCSLNHLRAYCHRLYAVASMRSVSWWMNPNPINRLELPKFKEPKRARPTLTAEEALRVLAALDQRWRPLSWRPLFATAFFLGLRRGELLALRKTDVDLVAGTITVARSGESEMTKGGDDGVVPIPEPLRPYLEAALKLSPSEWVFPAADGKQRAPATNLKAVLRRAMGRAGIVDGYEHRCRKGGCGYVEKATDKANRRCPNDGRALWIRAIPKSGIVFHSLRHTTATLLARAKVHPSVAQKILRHKDIETTLAIYTHLGDMEAMRAGVAMLDFGPLAERAPAPVVPLRPAVGAQQARGSAATLSADFLRAGSIPKS